MSTDWMDQIAKSRKFREKSITHGRKVYARYEDKRDANEVWQKRANFFYANVNILKESLFNSLPKPDVSRVQKGNFLDDASRVAALIVQRGLTYEINCAPHFDEAVKAAILERLVPGIGQVWLRFSVEKGEEGVTSGSEKIHIEHVFWEDFDYQPARLWSRVTWVSRKVHMTAEEVTERFGPDAIAKIGSYSSDKGDNNAPKEINEDKYCVYEIWDKKTRKVIFISEGMEEPLEEKDDPYKLTNFFPCPCPIISNVTTNKFLPVTDFHISQDQYAVLDTLYARINLIIKAIKVAGIYNASNMDIQRMLSGSENTLIAVDNWAMMAENGGVTGNIEWYPVEQVAQVLMHLQTQFEAAKGILYEITGMSDIVRGASNQYETASAQQIKAQFASVRMNAYQRDVSIFVRDILRIISEFMCQLYSIEKMQMIVGQLAPPDMEFVEAAIGILRDDFQAKYNVDIQANSLTQADWALEKTQRMEVVQTLGQMISSIIQGVQASPQLAILGVNMIKFALAGFKGASEFEGYVDQVLDDMLRAQQEAQANPQPPQPTPEEQKMQMESQLEQARFQMEQQGQQAELQMDMQKQEMELGFKEREMGMKLQMMEAEFAHKERMHGLEIEIQMVKLQLEEQKAMMGLEADAAKSAQTLDQADQKHKQSMTQSKEATAAKPESEGAE